MAHTTLDQTDRTIVYLETLSRRDEKLTSVIENELSPGLAKGKDHYSWDRRRCREGYKKNSAPPKEGRGRGGNLFEA